MIKHNKLLSSKLYNIYSRQITDLAYRSSPVFTNGITNPLDILFASPSAWSLTEVFQSISELLVPAKHKTSGNIRVSFLHKLKSVTVGVMFAFSQKLMMQR